MNIIFLLEYLPSIGPHHLNVYMGLVLQTHIMSSSTRNTVIMHLAQQDRLVLTCPTHKPENSYVLTSSAISFPPSKSSYVNLSSFVYHYFNLHEDV